MKINTPKNQIKMDENKQALMKIFSSVLRDRAKSETEYREISPEMLRFFSRKDLIEIITFKIYDGTVPEEHNLIEMENEDLLTIIGDDMYIISYVTEKWSAESVNLPLKPAQEFIKSLRDKRKEAAEKKAAEKKETAGSVGKNEGKEARKESTSELSETKA